jgi:predicted nucleic acid-binding protein
MLEAIALDQKTMIIRSDVETDFSEIINFVIKKDKKSDIESFLKFAEANRKVDKNAMTDKIFIDSNIWCYFFLQDEKDKYKIAGDFFSTKENDTLFVISYQMINEVTNRLIQKKFDAEVIRENIEYMCKICTIQNFSMDIIMLAFDLRKKYSFSF